MAMGTNGDLKHARYELVVDGVSTGHPCDFCGEEIHDEGWGLRRVCELPPEHKGHPLGPCPTTCVQTYAHKACGWESQ